MRNTALNSILVVWAAAPLASGQSLVDTSDLLGFADEQLRFTVTDIDFDFEAFPRRTNERGSMPTGDWVTVPRWEWTSGFFPGQLWMMYEHTGDEDYRTWAEGWTGDMLSQATRTNTHDLGFMIFGSAGKGHALLPDGPTRTLYRDTIITATQSLVNGRWDGNIDGGNGAFRAWGNFLQEYVIIDTMMNLEMVFWASRNGGDPVWADLAIRHADTALTRQVRANGSTFQVARYDWGTGDFIGNARHQGERVDSTWARGQSWALHGFTTTYRETGLDRFRDAAQAVADFYIDALPSNTPADGIPWFDLEALTTDYMQKDTSSAAIAASGLIELSGLVSDPADKQRYFDAGESLSLAMSSTEYLARTAQNEPGIDSSGIVVHSVGNSVNSNEEDVSIVYTDYYFIEALLRYQARLVPGDFNHDELFDCADVDALVAAIAGGSNDLQFDLTGDSSVDNADLSEWLTIAGAAENASGNPYLPGDADLNGVVDFLDFNIWAKNRFTNNAAWCLGDFNASGVIDFLDFNIWAVNRFQSSLVPEPSSILLLLFGGAIYLRRQSLTPPTNS